MSVSFTPGSSDGDMVCVNVTVIADAMVERVMNFTVELSLDTVGESLSLGNDATLVILVDSDGKQIPSPLLTHNQLLTCYPPQLLSFRSQPRLRWPRATQQWRCASL